MTVGNAMLLVHFALYPSIPNVRALLKVKVVVVHILNQRCRVYSLFLLVILVIPKHTFTDEKPSFGYSNFVEWTHLMNPSNGFIFNDAIIVEAKVKMHDRLLDSNSVGLNTLRPGPTQYIGLKNQVKWNSVNQLKLKF